MSTLDAIAQQRSARNRGAEYTAPISDLPNNTPAAAVPPTNARIGIRAITDEDLPEVVSLLHIGFPSRSRGRLHQAIQRIGNHNSSGGFAKYGQVLTAGQRPVGALLTISSSLGGPSVRYRRSNVACWYVLPQFRLYAALLVNCGCTDQSVTHLNISPAKHTWPTIEAQGFQRFCDGAFAAIPTLTSGSRDVRIISGARITERNPRLSDHDYQMMKDHADFGCLTLICRSKDGDHPFVFRRRLFSRLPVPAGQLIFGPDQETFSRFYGPISRFLALRGLPWILVGSNNTIKGVPGVFIPEKLPMYFRGPNRPDICDLRYTEAAVVGF